MVPFSFPQTLLKSHVMKKRSPVLSPLVGVRPGVPAGVPALQRLASPVSSFSICIPAWSPAHPKITKRTQFKNVVLITNASKSRIFTHWPSENLTAISCHNRYKSSGNPSENGSLCAVSRRFSRLRETVFNQRPPIEPVVAN